MTEHSAFGRRLGCLAIVGCIVCLWQVEFSRGSEHFSSRRTTCAELLEPLPKSPDVASQRLEVCRCLPRLTLWGVSRRLGLLGRLLRVERGFACTFGCGSNELAPG